VHSILQEHSEKKEDWVAVGYSHDLKYIGKVGSEEETTLMVRFLEREMERMKLKRMPSRWKKV